MEGNASYIYAHAPYSYTLVGEHFVHWCNCQLATLWREIEDDSYYNDAVELGSSYMSLSFVELSVSTSSGNSCEYKDADLNKVNF
ncbi:conserved hypothetical protein [Ricinus communis]|uniref:Uncharacterized protein n=1 Tax=Ricinus communis TaxID=3988 RepID=B9RM76_RICCO|nr:conserved hypothetical protein [Ricinus communis]